MKKRTLLFGAAAVVLLMSIGCLQTTSIGKSQMTQDPHKAAIEELSARNPEGLPDYAYSSMKSKAGYVAAIELKDVFSTVPCYCSCGAVGHESLKDCFIDGEGFEEHASFCDICVSEALDVYQWQKQGLSPGEIRLRIDEKYARYGEPTDTPRV